ncbi:hypothetical protein F7R14_10795 [Pseudomonas lini]|uniref:Uncharacterized protein n=1 Tax=Pseudomonas lini TaxID=163011 RepID=A0A7V7P4M3_9PSED|nr:hypothetical protein F7R14_10795 [Pseudomonas lini]
MLQLMKPASPWSSPACATSVTNTTINCGSGLARDAGASVCQADRGDAIAGKPAPTEKQLSAASRISVIRGF